MKQSIGSPVIALGTVVLGVQIGGWLLGQGWVDVRTGLVLDPILHATSASSMLEVGSMRGIASLLRWLGGTQFALLCLAVGFFLTSLEGRLD